MPEITIRLHPDLAEKLLAAGPEGGQALSSLWRQAERAVRSHGGRIAYAPAVLPGGHRLRDERPRRPSRAWSSRSTGRGR